MSKSKFMTAASNSVQTGSNFGVKTKGCHPITITQHTVNSRIGSSVVINARIACFIKRFIVRDKYGL